MKFAGIFFAIKIWVLLMLDKLNSKTITGVCVCLRVRMYELMLYIYYVKDTIKVVSITVL